MNNRKLQALRNLAERPGTESEGKLAREILDRLERKLPEDDSEATRWFWFEKYLRTRDIVAHRRELATCSSGANQMTTSTTDVFETTSSRIVIVTNFSTRQRMLTASSWSWVLRLYRANPSAVSSVVFSIFPEEVWNAR